MWAIITKIQSESKSQRRNWLYLIAASCEQSLRRYNLKANHNLCISVMKIQCVVSNHYEDTIWKQITTYLCYLHIVRALWAIITKIQSESKSQPNTFKHSRKTSCEQSLRRYNLKANHNDRFDLYLSFSLWAIITKIQSESKSQHNVCYLVFIWVVSNHYEDTIWKQITTSLRRDFSVLSCEQSLRRYNLKANHNVSLRPALQFMLWAIITKIQSESKSQHRSTHLHKSESCEQSLRRYNLKANHNAVMHIFTPPIVVSNHYEDTIWKQITTINRIGLYVTKVVSNHYEDTIWKQITTPQVV